MINTVCRSPSCLSTHVTASFLPRTDTASRCCTVVKQTVDLFEVGLAIAFGRYPLNNATDLLLVFNHFVQRISRVFNNMQF